MGQSWPVFVYFRPLHITIQILNLKKRRIFFVLGIRTRGLGWKAQTDPPCHSGRPRYNFFCWHCHTTSHSTTPHPMNRARRWYTVITLLYDLCSGLNIFGFKREEWEQITFSLAKLMNILHIAFTRDKRKHVSAWVHARRANWWSSSGRLKRVMPETSGRTLFTSAEK